jgi:autophagy-related protein 27
MLSNGVSSLRYLGYEKDNPDKDVDILKLEWDTKYACESQEDEDDVVKSGHWGFFTWFLIM